MSQDNLENWFPAVRSRGGCNNNPNCDQFKAIFKRLLVHHELRISDNANCVVDNINIFEVSSGSLHKDEFSTFYQQNEEI